ncbi:MAG: putative heme transporter [Actinomycetota bacterium]|jgi:predicted PurR-regulated permease PerM|nr:putative heme transporter [Actinomycetota bacterium]
MKLWRPRPAAPAPGARKVLTGPERKKAVEEAIPVGVEVAGQWAWRILAVIAVLVVFGILIATLKEIVIPFMVSILVSALLVPFKNVMIRIGWPRWVAVVVAMVVALIVISGLVFVIVQQVRSGLPDIETRSVVAFNNFKDFLRTSPLQISDAQLNGYVDQVGQAIQANSSTLLNGAVSVGTTAVSLITGTLLTIFATIFILIDGAGIWAWVVRLFPRKSRPAIDGAGRAGWVTLTSFVRAQITVAAVDAVGITLGAFIIGLVAGGFPLLIPIGILVFLGSFIPVVGAVVAGALAVLVALVYDGPVAALFMLGVVILVQELEGHFLQPVLMGSAVKVHGLAVVFAVAGGSFLAGIPGALFAVPVVAVVNVMVKYIARGEWRAIPKPQVSDVEIVNE